MSESRIESKAVPEQRSQGFWWETYIIRYPIPSLVGGLALFAVLLALPETRKQVLELVGAGHGKTDFDKGGIILLGAALLIGGIVLCYLASTPMLVLHALRPFIRDTKLSSSIIRIVLALAGIVALAIAFGPVRFATLVGGVKSAVMFYFVLVIFCQIFLIERFVRKHQSRELFNYYRALSTKREHKGAINFVISMRHLREHGNAVSIVCLELLLAAAAYFMLSNEQMSRAEQILAAAAMLGCWILPGAVVWYIAQQLEAELTVADLEIPSTTQ